MPWRHYDLTGRQEKSHHEIIRRSSWAAGLAAVITLALFMFVFQNGARLALADVLANLNNIQSIKMKIHNKAEMGGQTVNSDGIMYVDEAHHRIRQEWEEGSIVNIFALKEHKGLMLMPDAKTAIRLDIDHLPKERSPEDMLAGLKKMQESGAEDLGEKEIQGQKLHGFRSSEKDGETITETTVWADPKTKMPIVVEKTISNGLLPMHLTMSEFEWNWPIDEAAFSRWRYRKAIRFPIRRWTWESPWKRMWCWGSRRPLTLTMANSRRG